jgi:fermentation-respiration switch protein FrsA (DUF1100 family)
VSPSLVPVGDREDVAFQSSGVRCAGWLFRPARDAEHVPVVVLGPGLAGVRGVRLDVFAARFAQAGMAALVFDYRHFGASGGQPRQLVSIRRQLADWHAAIAAARAQPGLNPTRIGLWGGSIAGGHVLRVASEDPTIRAVVAQVPLTSGISSALAIRPAPQQQVRLFAAGLRDGLRGLLHVSPRYIPVVGPPRSLAVLTSPDADPDYRAIVPPGWDDRVAARVALGLLFYRPGQSARRISCPIFVALGQVDAITPPEPAARLVSAAPRVENRRYPVRHFQSFLGPESDALVTDGQAFLRRHLADD